MGRSTLEIAVASAVFYFNDGGQGVVEVFKNLGLDIGYFTHDGLWKKNEKCAREMEIKSSEKEQKRGKKLRGSRKGLQDKNNEAECTVYGPGDF